MANSVTSLVASEVTYGVELLGKELQFGCADMQEIPVKLPEQGGVQR